MVFVNEWPTQRVDDARTIDHERNAVLKSEGGLGRVPGHNLVLFWNDSAIRFIGGYDITEETGNTSGIDWNIRMLRIPKNLQDKTEEIKKLIVEALSEHGHLYDKKNFSRLTITFSKQKIMYY